MDSLPRDGGEPTRPMTGDEIVTFARRVQPILNDASKVDVAADEHGGLTVTLWPDDTDGDGSQIISFRPVTAVKRGRVVRAVEWIASPRQVRVFHGDDSTVLDRPDLDAAKRRMPDHPEVVVNGITLDESDIDAMRAAMTDAYQRQVQDWRAEMSMGEF